MSQFIISIVVDGWLVIACFLFTAIVWNAFSPSARSQMERHARIPFKDEGGTR
ncbi:MULTISPECIES: cbb3-type cytochrome c oxidase subunit 3 [unclassified Sinorhizobium]|uniref:cbb3-type cytochrome c oxidase subunit 3 n=1 Tax=unclassified Sinorhizobium TaxID=2613772 RepID=UPI0024C3DE1A|nr:MULTISPECIES: cbb3-type cytochrome c oxidase subunit 3 [unclassified Sinorhizobium]MDK1376805.1 cbb3-type cytochrome c oxidase subunit 3 [Sinorhizobium sp. 6-70]MDK1479577.1 cbb3-type cytochrome c oxidase subunit 3 [Sinorhizobium sp. 6-117]